jgi:hypothetical protein
MLIELLMALFLVGCFASLDGLFITLADVVGFNEAFVD